MEEPQLVVKVPLHGKYGVDKFTLVDFQDLDVANKFKWTVHHGYVRVNRNSEEIYLHRLIMSKYDNNDHLVDYINNNRLDNTRSNLRRVTNSQNCKNRRINSNNTSGFKGVWWHTRDKKWHAQIAVDGDRIHLGYFEDIKDAVIVYN